MLASRIDHFTSVLFQRLSRARALHCIGSAHTAVGLAIRWNADPEEALAAGLLHDIAKQEPPETLRRLVEESGEDFAVEEPFPKVWHAVAGAIIARREFGLSEKAARAILLHPTGEAEMNLLEKIIFLSDYLEPSRVWDGVRELRALARRDLDAAVKEAIRRKTVHVREKGAELHPRSRRALEMAETE